MSIIIHSPLQGNIQCRVEIIVDKAFFKINSIVTYSPWAWILESNAAITTASVAAARSCLEWRLSIAQKGAEI